MPRSTAARVETVVAARILASRMHGSAVIRLSIYMRAAASSLDRVVFFALENHEHSAVDGA